MRGLFFQVILTMWFVVWGGVKTMSAQPVPPEGMVFIPSGSYEMGWEGASNKTPHTVHTDGFFIDQFEVTQRPYHRVQGQNPSKFSGEDRPVEQVTWMEARNYCSKIGKRLPTEAEWEKAARAGTFTLYFWGNEEREDRSWHKGNAEGETHPVGQLKPNPYGVYDLYGNVWEWVADWYDKNYYEISPQKNPLGPAEGENRVLRGGSWYSGLRHQTSVTRYWSDPGVRNSNFGFRCAQDAP